jgi:hypothetical protein
VVESACHLNRPAAVTTIDHGSSIPLEFPAAPPTYRAANNIIHFSEGTARCRSLLCTHRRKITPYRFDHSQSPICGLHFQPLDSARKSEWSPMIYFLL